MMPMKVVPLSMLKLSGFCASIARNVVSTPPVASSTMIGVSNRAKIISVACTVSVQLTARKPPTKV
ncbi:hypothetical protein D3C78_1213900 [compost metagenome]